MNVRQFKVILNNEDIGSVMLYPHATLKDIEDYCKEIIIFNKLNPEHYSCSVNITNSSIVISKPLKDKSRKPRKNKEIKSGIITTNINTNQFDYFESLPLPALESVLLNMDYKQLNFICKNSKHAAKICKESRFRRLYEDKYGPAKIVFAEDDSVAKDIEDRLKLLGSMEFECLDNGMISFVVVISKQVNGRLQADIYNKNKKTHLLTYKNVNELWVGVGTYSNPFDKSEIGNTVLLVMDQVCILVARDITKFILPDNTYITRFVSTVGNSGVPYGFIGLNTGYIIPESINCIPDSFISLEESRGLTDQDLECIENERKSVPIDSEIVIRSR